mgnify:FL=1
MKDPQQNQQTKRKAPVKKSYIQLTLNFYIEGDDSLKGLCAEELLSRVIRTSNPGQRAKDSIPGLPEEFFQKVHNGLVKKYSIVVEQKSKL